MLHISVEISHVSSGIVATVCPCTLLREKNAVVFTVNEIELLSTPILEVKTTNPTLSFSYYLSVSNYVIL